MSLLSRTKKILGQQETKPAAKTKKATKTKKTKAAENPVVAIQVGQIDLRPLVTEKSVGRPGTGNVAVFRVNKQTSKGQIIAAVMERYKVKPLHVRTLIMNPKRRTRGRSVGKTNAWKKAYVSLPANTSIDLTI